eukprot:11121966-Alexandrium_andersonii.AAC.1
MTGHELGDWILLNVHRWATFKRASPAAVRSACVVCDMPVVSRIRFRINNLFNMPRLVSVHTAV